MAKDSSVILESNYWENLVFRWTCFSSGDEVILFPIVNVFKEISVESKLWTAENTHQLCKPVHSPDVRLFLSLDNPKNAHVSDDTEHFGADEADLLV